jgi:hypothetical protein
MIYKMSKKSNYETKTRVPSLIRDNIVLEHAESICAVFLVLRGEVCKTCRRVTLMKRFVEAESEFCRRKFHSPESRWESVTCDVGGDMLVSFSPIVRFSCSLRQSTYTRTILPPCEGGALHGREWIIMAIAKCACNLLYCNTKKNKILTRCRYYAIWVVLVIVCVETHGILGGYIKIHR